MRDLVFSGNIKRDFFFLLAIYKKEMNSIGSVITQEAPFSKERPTLGYHPISLILGRVKKYGIFRGGFANGERKVKEETKNL